MAVVLFSQWPPGATEPAECVAERINERLGEQPPARVLYHAEEPTAEGGWWTFIVWELEEAFKRFHRDILYPVLDEVGASRAQVHQLQVAWAASLPPS